MKRVRVFVVIFVVLVVAAFLVLRYTKQTDTGMLVLSGIIEADETDIAFRIPGKIAAINFDRGDMIDSGMVVAQLDKAELAKVESQARLSCEALAGSIEAIKVGLKTVNRNLGKVKELLKTGAATQSQYDDLDDQKSRLEAELTATRKQLDAAYAAADLAGIRLSYADLSAPTNGTVVARAAEPGEVVNAGSIIYTIADLKNLTVKVYLPEKHLGAIKLNESVELEIDSYPEKRFEGIVEYISDKAEFTPKNIQTKEERVKQVFAVDVAIDSHDGILKPGLPCDIIIPID